MLRSAFRIPAEGTVHVLIDSPWLKVYGTGVNSIWPWMRITSASWRISGASVIWLAALFAGCSLRLIAVISGENETARVSFIFGLYVKKRLCPQIRGRDLPQKRAIGTLIAVPVLFGSEGQRTGKEKV
jgi:hypothetical protein